MVSGKATRSTARKVWFATRPWKRKTRNMPTGSSPQPKAYQRCPPSQRRYHRNYRQIQRNPALDTSRCRRHRRRRKPASPTRRNPERSTRYPHHQNQARKKWYFHKLCYPASMIALPHARCLPPSGGSRMPIGLLNPDSSARPSPILHFQSQPLQHCAPVTKKRLRTSSSSGGPARSQRLFSQARKTVGPARWRGASRTVGRRSGRRSLRSPGVRPTPEPSFYHRSTPAGPLATLVRRRGPHAGDVVNLILGVGGAGLGGAIGALGHVEAWLPKSRRGMEQAVGIALGVEIPTLITGSAAGLFFAPRSLSE